MLIWKTHFVGTSRFFSLWYPITGFIAKLWKKTSTILRHVILSNRYFFPDFSLRNVCVFPGLFFQSLPCRHLLIQSQQWKHQNNVWSLFKVNNKDTSINKFKKKTQKQKMLHDWTIAQPPKLIKTTWINAQKTYKCYNNLWTKSLIRSLFLVICGHQYLIHFKIAFFAEIFIVWCGSNCVDNLRC